MNSVPQKYIQIITNKTGFIIFLLHCAALRFKYVLICTDACPFHRFVYTKRETWEKETERVKVKMFSLIESTPLCSSMKNIIQNML